MATSEGGVRAMMVTELKKLQAPLRRLQHLSFCLADEPDELDIRRDIAAILCRRAVLQRHLADFDNLQEPVADPLDAHHRGQT